MKIKHESIFEGLIEALAEDLTPFSAHLFNPMPLAEPGACVPRIPQSPIEPGNYTVASSYFQFYPSQNAFYLESSDKTSDFRRHYRVFQFETNEVN